MVIDRRERLTVALAIVLRLHGLVLADDADDSAENGYRGGRGAVSMDGGLHIATKRKVVRRRESMREDGRFERDDRLVQFQGAFDIILDNKGSGESVH